MFGRKSTVMQDEARSWDIQQRDAGWLNPTPLSNLIPGKADMLSIGVIISRSRKVRRPKSKKGTRCG